MWHAYRCMEILASYKDGILIFGIDLCGRWKICDVCFGLLTDALHCVRMWTQMERAEKIVMFQSDIPTSVVGLGVFLSCKHQQVSSLVLVVTTVSRTNPSHPDHVWWMRTYNVSGVAKICMDDARVISHRQLGGKWMWSVAERTHSHGSILRELFSLVISSDLWTYGGTSRNDDITICRRKQEKRSKIDQKCQ